MGMPMDDILCRKEGGLKKAWLVVVKVLERSGDGVEFEQNFEKGDGDRNMENMHIN